MSSEFKFFYFDKVKSTNVQIKKIMNSTKKNLALLSKIQTEGKGRLNNIWYSQAGDLTCSFLIKERFSVKKLGQINILASVALIKVLKKRYSDLVFKLKWPNDIYLRDKKLAGILLESKISGVFLDYFIIGFGVNFVTTPEGLNYKTVCLGQFTNKLDIKNFFLELANSINKNLEYLRNNEFSYLKNFWLKNSKDFGNEMQIKNNNKFFVGKFIDINDLGSIVIKTSSKNQLNFSYGEII